MLIMQWNLCSISFVASSCFLLLTIAADTAEAFVSKTTTTTTTTNAPVLSFPTSAASASQVFPPLRMLPMESSLILSSNSDTSLQFTDVVLPTYLGIAFAYVSYQIDRDSDYAKNLIQSLKEDDKALGKVAMVAAMALVSVPIVAGIHTLACSLIGIDATATSTATIPLPGITASSIPLSQVVVPIVIGLASVYLSYQVDQDSEYVVKLWNKYINNEKEEAVVGTWSAASTTTTTTKDVADTPAVAVVAAADQEEEGQVTTTTKTKEKVSKVAKTAYAPWLEMLVPKDENSKRRKVAQFVGFLYLPWLPMFLPNNKSKQEQEDATPVEA